MYKTTQTSITLHKDLTGTTWTEAQLHLSVKKPDGTIDILEDTEIAWTYSSGVSATYSYTGMSTDGIYKFELLAGTLNSPYESLGKITVKKYTDDSSATFR